MGIKFEYKNVYEMSDGRLKTCVTNAKEIFPLLMEDLKQAGYTQVSFNVVGDKLPDYQGCNFNEKNEEKIDSFLKGFYSPVAHHSIYVYPFLESNYSHTHSLILGKYDLTWGGGDNNSYAIKPEFAREVGSCVFDLVGGKWKRQRRRYGKRFIKAMSEHVCLMSDVCSDRDIRMIARIYGFYRALIGRLKDMPLYINSSNDYLRDYALWRMGIKS